MSNLDYLTEYEKKKIRILISREIFRLEQFENIPSYEKEKEEFEDILRKLYKMK